MGPIRNPCRYRSASVGSMVHPYVRSPRRQATRESHPSPLEHDPCLIRTPSPRWSPGTPDSRQGAFSPTQMVDNYYMAIDAGNLAAGLGNQGHDGDGTQSSTTYPSEGVRLHKYIGDNNEVMELDKRAMAPAQEASRAP